MPRRAGRHGLWKVRRHAGDLPERHVRRRSDRRKQHRAGRLADGDHVDRRCGSQGAVDILSAQRCAHESTGVCCHERRAHHGRQIVAKVRDNCQ
jgi:hypothetical protein